MAEYGGGVGEEEIKKVLVKRSNFNSLCMMATELAEIVDDIIDVNEKFDGCGSEFALCFRYYRTYQAIFGLWRSVEFRKNEWQRIGPHYANINDVKIRK